MIKYYVLFFVFFLTSSVYSQTVEEYELHQLKALEGLERFGIYVWDIEGYHKDSTLNRKDIEEFVHRSLQAVGINTASFSDARSFRGAPNLEVQLRVHQKRNEDSYVYNVILRFIQDVKLERNNYPFYSAIVWERDELGHAELNDLNLEIKIALNSLLDEFIADFKKVN